MRAPSDECMLSNACVRGPSDARTGRMILCVPTNDLAVLLTPLTCALPLSPTPRQCLAGVANTAKHGADIGKLP